MSCDRLEHEHLLADLGAALDAHVDQCEDCSARLRGYQTIAALIAEGTTSHRAPADWGQRTLARVKAARRSRQRRVAMLSALGAAAAAAIVLVCLVHLPGGPDSGGPVDSSATVVQNTEPMPAAVEPAPSPKLALQIVGGDGWRGVAHPGEEVHARAVAPGAPHVEIRVYREARRLVARCPEPGSSVCLGGDPALIWKVPAVGTYQVLLVVSTRPIAAPRGSLEDDVAAATAAGARVVDMETLDVR